LKGQGDGENKGERLGETAAERYGDLSGVFMSRLKP
jgi:hypothetical protein